MVFSQLNLNSFKKIFHPQPWWLFSLFYFFVLCLSKKKTLLQPWNIANIHKKFLIKKFVIGLYVVCTKCVTFLSILFLFDVSYSTWCCHVWWRHRATISIHALVCRQGWYINSFYLKVFELVNKSTKTLTLNISMYGLKKHFGCI